MGTWSFYGRMTISTPKHIKKIIQYLQPTYPQYSAHATAKSFLYRDLKRQRESATRNQPTPRTAQGSSWGKQKKSQTRKSNNR